MEEGGERTDKGKFPEGSPRRRVEGWESCQDEIMLSMKVVLKGRGEGGDVITRGVFSTQFWLTAVRCGMRGEVSRWLRVSWYVLISKIF